VKKQTSDKVLRFSGILYLPRDSEGWDGLRYHVRKMGVGRLWVFDRNGQLTTRTGKAFNNIGQMLNLLLKEYGNRIKVQIPTSKKK
jgi:hypothetical protein